MNRSLLKLGKIEDPGMSIYNIPFYVEQLSTGTAHLKPHLANTVVSFVFLSGGF